MRLVAPALFLFGALAAAPAFAQSAAVSDDPELEARARALEGRIRAPCCWNQTIDIHASESAQELRHLIRRRLRAGDSIEEIEAGIVAEHGERILAVPPDSPLGAFATFALVGAFLAGGGLFWAASRWRKRGPGARTNAAAKKPADAEKPEPSAKTNSSPEGDEWDERLDAELEDR